RDEPEFRFIKMPTRMLHGPISHVLMFAGIHLNLGLIAIAEILKPAINISLQDYVLYGVTGIYLGIFYAIAQIYNLTWKHQLPLALWITIVYLALASLVDLVSLYLPYNFFFLTFSITYTLGLAGKYIRSRLKRQRYVYQS